MVRLELLLYGLGDRLRALCLAGIDVHDAGNQAHRVVDLPHPLQHVLLMFHLLVDVQDPVCQPLLDHLDFPLAEVPEIRELAAQGIDGALAFGEVVLDVFRDQLLQGEEPLLDAVPPL